MSAEIVNMRYYQSLSSGNMLTFAGRIFVTYIVREPYQE